MKLSRSHARDWNFDSFGTSLLCVHWNVVRFSGTRWCLWCWRTSFPWAPWLSRTLVWAWSFGEARALANAHKDKWKTSAPKDEWVLRQLLIIFKCPWGKFQVYLRIKKYVWNPFVKNTLLLNIVRTINLCGLLISPFITQKLWTRTLTPQWTTKLYQRHYFTFTTL